MIHYRREFIFSSLCLHTCIDGFYFAAVFIWNESKCIASYSCQSIEALMGCPVMSVMWLVLI